jgi:outer membrane biosynthesis protein TonB
MTDTAGLPDAAPAAVPTPEAPPAAPAPKKAGKKLAKPRPKVKAKAKPKPAPKKAAPKKAVLKAAKPKKAAPAKKAATRPAAEGKLHITDSARVFRGQRLIARNLLKEGMTVQTFFDKCTKAGIDGHGILGKWLNVYKCVKVI